MKQAKTYLVPLATVLPLCEADILTLSEANASHGESVYWNDKLEII